MYVLDFGLRLYESRGKSRPVFGRGKKSDVFWLVCNPDEISFAAASGMQTCNAVAQNDSPESAGTVVPGRSDGTQQFRRNFSMNADAAGSWADLDALDYTRPTLVQFCDARTPELHSCRLKTFAGRPMWFYFDPQQVDPEVLNNMADPGDVWETWKQHGQKASSAMVRAAAHPAMLGSGVAPLMKRLCAGNANILDMCLGVGCEQAQCKPQQHQLTPAG